VLNPTSVSGKEISAGGMTFDTVIEVIITVNTHGYACYKQKALFLNQGWYNLTKCLLCQDKVELSTIQ
jgi:hypothetical protein